MSRKNKKGSRTTQFLIGSFSLLLLISIVAFLCLGYYMDKVNTTAIDSVGDLYMAGMDEQVSSHFRTLLDLKLEQVETIVKVVSTNDFAKKDKLYDELIYRSQARDFNYLGLFSDEGYIEMLYGQQVQLADPEPFYSSLRKKEKKVAVGKDNHGNELVLFGAYAEYPMKNNKKSTALIAALPRDYISTKLNTNKTTSLMNLHIIRKNGSFIVSDLSDKYPDYFSSLYEKYGAENKDNIDIFIKELTVAMNNRQNYSTILNVSGNRQQIYCTSLPYSEWHLITVLPFNTMNQTIEDLGQKRTLATIIVFAVILFVLLLIFSFYYKMSRQQMQELNLAREDALKATKAKSEFLSNMSHDIRTPMNAIVGMTAIAVTHIDDKEQVQHCLRKITLSGKHLLGLINDVLDMSKIESGKMTLTAERISLRDTVESVVSIIQPQIKAKEQNFNVHIDNITIEDVYCDSVRLNQILLNLLSNAVKYTQENGTIQLSLFQENTPSPKGDNFIRTHVIVQDNGIGMTSDFLEHIFDSYSRADNKRVQKTEGAGLGMAITKYIVDAMGGTIAVESAPQQGTEFHLTLDLEKADAKEIEMILPDWKMLVVDDDEVLCRTAVDSLDSIGITADWTLSGEKAIEMITKHHEMNDDYQIVLLDWKLPDMDAIYISKHIRQVIDKDMTIILISAYDWSEFETEARDAGINGFISKPLFKSTLFYGLKKYMGIEETQNENIVDTDLHGRRILVAEDNEINWEIIEELLSDLGIEMDWAENGQICLDKFQNSEPGYYDAILMDIRMPVMNGYEATTALRKSEHKDAKNIPIIAMTADAFSEDIQRCLDCGMNAHTAKPINLNEVINLLKKFIL